MTRLLPSIKTAILNERYLTSSHADERCEIREIPVLEIVSSIDDTILVNERPKDEPDPTVVVRQTLMDGSEVEIVRAWLSKSGQEKLVTVYFPDSSP